MKVNKYESKNHPRKRNRFFNESIARIQYLMIKALVTHGQCDSVRRNSRQTQVYSTQTASTVTLCRSQMVKKKQ